MSVISLNYFDCVIRCCTIADDKDREGFIIIECIMYNVYYIYLLHIYICVLLWHLETILGKEGLLGSQYRFACDFPLLYFYFIFVMNPTPLCEN